MWRGEDNNYSAISLAFVEPECWLLYSHKRPLLDPVLSQINPVHILIPWRTILIFSSYLAPFMTKMFPFRLGFQPNILCAFLHHQSHPPRFGHMKNIWQKCILWSSWLCILLQLLITSPPLGPTPSLHSPSTHVLPLRWQIISHTTGEITVLYTSIFALLGMRWEGKRYLEYP